MCLCLPDGVGGRSLAPTDYATINTRHALLKEHPVMLCLRNIWSHDYAIINTCHALHEQHLVMRAGVR